jgi:hypothetical protein
LGSHADADLERRTVWLLHLLILARVHGKSPVEYLDAARQAWVTQHVTTWLPHPIETVSAFTTAWEKAIAES